MQPLYRDGDVLFISPGAEPEAGDRVVVKLSNNESIACDGSSEISETSARKAWTI